jgi:hypothetical protein
MSTYQSLQSTCVRELTVVISVSVKAKQEKERNPTVAEAAVREGSRSWERSWPGADPVSHVSGVAVRSVFDWVSWYRHGGAARTEEGRHGGDLEGLRRVMKWLYDAVTLGNPAPVRICLWTLGIIREMPSRTRIELSKSRSAVCWRTWV